MAFSEPSYKISPIFAKGRPLPHGHTFTRTFLEICHVKGPISREVIHVETNPRATWQTVEINSSPLSIPFSQSLGSFCTFPLLGFPIAFDQRERFRFFENQGFKRRRRREEGFSLEFIFFFSVLEIEV